MDDFINYLKPYIIGEITLKNCKLNLTSGTKYMIKYVNINSTIIYLGIIFDTCYNNNYYFNYYYDNLQVFIISNININARYYELAHDFSCNYFNDLIQTHYFISNINFNYADKNANYIYAVMHNGLIYITDYLNDKHDDIFYFTKKIITNPFFNDNYKLQLINKRVC